MFVKKVEHLRSHKDIMDHLSVEILCFQYLAESSPPDKFITVNDFYIIPQVVERKTTDT
jgi:hypothetical protein